MVEQGHILQYLSTGESHISFSLSGISKKKTLFIKIISKNPSNDIYVGKIPASMYITELHQTYKWTLVPPVLFLYDDRQRDLSRFQNQNLLDILGLIKAMFLCFKI